MKVALAASLAWMVVFLGDFLPAAQEAPLPGGGTNAESAGSPEQDDSLKAPPDVAAALAARSPANAHDLRLIETQLQRVIQHVLPSTCGVQIGPAAGSGVVVSKDGLVLTAAHVIGRPGRRAWVELPDGRRFRGRTLGADHDADAGMIKLDEPPADLSFTPVYKGPDLNPGEWVITIGQPGGIVEERSPPVRFGRVLFLGDDVLCTDCKLVGGDSGGPLFNMNGEVVGIHSSIGPSLTHNFHVPASSFNSNWGRLVKGDLWGGRYDRERDDRKVLLGVSGREQDGKCLITQVMPGMPAEKAGVKSGDVILAVNDREIKTFDELSGIVFFKAPGEELRLSIDRNGEKLTVTATLAEED